MANAAKWESLARCQHASSDGGEVGRLVHVLLAWEMASNLFVWWSDLRYAAYAYCLGNFAFLEIPTIFIFYSWCATYCVYILLKLSILMIIMSSDC